VTIAGTGLTGSIEAVTSDAGTFRVAGLPPGRYLVEASKAGWVPMAYGAKRPGRTASPLSVSAGATARATIRLPRGAAIAGTVSDSTGEPRPDVGVAALALRFDPSTGRRRLVREGLTTLATDDRGEYRIFGLPPGEYVVYATPDPREDSNGARLLSSSDISRALADARLASSLSRPTPGILPAPTLPPTSPAAPEARVALTPIYYPGVAAIDNALMVTVAEGEERLGVDIALDYVPTSTLSGRVELVEGRPLPAVRITPATTNAGLELESVRDVRVDDEGQFTVGNLPPGRYVVTARRGTRHDGPPDESWTPETVALYGGDAAEVSLRLQPPLSMSGRIEFRASRRSPARQGLPGSVAIPLISAAGRSVDSFPAMQIQSDGSFSLDGLPPGALRRIGVAGIRSPMAGWWLDAVMADGRNLLDAPPVLTTSSKDVVVMLSDHAAVLSGVVRRPDRMPAGGHTVIAFPADRRGWFFGSWRIAGVRTGADGGYAIAHLPPGDYLVAAADDVEADEWFDPLLLERLAREAVPLTMGEANMTLDLVTAAAAEDAR
jgi:hypothetical protein